MKPLRYAGIATLVLVLLLAGLIGFAPTWLRLGLKAYGIEDVAFGSLRIGLDGAELDGLKVGNPADQSIERIALDYSLSKLLSGRVDRLTVTGLRVRTNLDDLTSDEPTSSEPETPPILIPANPYVDELIVEDSQIDLETPIGNLTLPFRGWIKAGEDQLTFELVADEARLGMLEEGVSADIALTGSLPVDDAEWLDRLVASGRLSLRATDGVLPDLADGVDGDGTITFNIENGKLLATTEGLNIGIERLAFDPGPLPFPWRMNAGTAARPLQMTGDRDGSDWRLMIDGPLGLDAKRGALRTDFDLVLLLGDDGQLRSIEKGHLDLKASDLAWQGTALSAGRATLDIQGEAAALQGSLSLDLDGLAWAKGPYAVDEATLDQELDLAFDGRSFDLSLAEQGRISIGRFSAVDQLESGWFTIKLHPGDEPFLSIDADDRRWRHRLDAEIDPVRLETTAGQWWARIEDLAIDATGSAEGLEQAAIVIKRGRMDLPRENLALTGIESALNLTGNDLALAEKIPLTIRNIRPIGEPANFTPLRLTADILPTTERVDLKGKLITRTKPAATLDIAGTHDLTTEKGRLEFDLAKVSFDPGGLQPGDFSPILRDVLEETIGQMAMTGTIAWEKGNLTSSADLLIEELGLSIGPARLERVNTLLQFDSLIPPTMAAGQELAIGLLDVGLPLTDGLVSMKLGADGELAVDRLTWRFADGKVSAEPFTFGSDVKDLTMTLNVDQLDLDGLLGLTELDGLGGEGRIDGIIPLTINDAGAVIAGGKLEATGEGFLRYRPAEAPGALQAGGAGVGLMLQALENFRYDELDITLDGRTDGKTDIGLHIRGANPDLYDGYPIEFNLDLEGNLANIIRTNLSNYQIPDRIRERLQGFEP